MNGNVKLLIYHSNRRPIMKCKKTNIYKTYKM